MKKGGEGIPQYLKGVKSDMRYLGKATVGSFKACQSHQSTSKYEIELDTKI